MKAFKEVAESARHQVGPLTHKQRVTRLYRNALRLQFSWAVDREIYLEKADEIRAEFDKLKDLPEKASRVQQALAEADEKLVKYTHPDPYVIPYMPGGSKFMRNSPPPPEPGLDLTGTNTPVWPDMVPITFRPFNSRDTLLVDFAKKTME